MTTEADGNRRVVLPGVLPGDVFDVQIQPDGTFLLVRLERPEAGRRLSREEALRAMIRLKQLLSRSPAFSTRYEMASGAWHQDR